MTGKRAVYTMEKALGEILIVIRTEENPERLIEKVEDIMQKLEESAWGVGYQDAKNDYEVD